MNLFEILKSEATWEDFLSYRSRNGFDNRRELERIHQFVAEKEYLPIVCALENGFSNFAYPRKSLISKMGTQKKRVVYIYPSRENIFLKMIAFKLTKYEPYLCENCYSFRLGVGAREAFLRFAKFPGISQYWSVKVDIKDYFNSIKISLLEPELRRTITDDPDLLHFLLALLQTRKAYYQGEVVPIESGVMPGTPTSAFFSNLFLRELDEWFFNRKVLYARYSDDIIFFGSQNEVEEYREYLEGFLTQKGLAINQKKFAMTRPGEAWTFLGFRFDNGTIDVAPNTVRKLCAKVRRKARALRRWKLRKGVADQPTLRAMNRKLNRKFYTTSQEGILNWSRWYFPVINTAVSLQKIDVYIQQNERFLVTGRHNKLNYRKVPYQLLKDNGYQPLVSAYFRYRADPLAFMHPNAPIPEDEQKKEVLCCEIEQI